MTIAERWANVNEKIKLMKNLTQWVEKTWNGEFNIHSSNFSYYIQYCNTSVVRISDHASKYHGCENYLFVEDFQDLRQLKKTIKNLVEQFLAEEKAADEEFEAGREERERKSNADVLRIQAMRAALAAGKTVYDWEEFI